MVKTVDVTGAVTRTVHDGKHMIVLAEGKKATVAVESLPYLRKRKLISEGKGKAKADPVQQPNEQPGGSEGDGQNATDLNALIELAKEAGYTYEDSGNGWHTISGGDIPADDLVKVRGDDELATKLGELTGAGGADAPPA